MSLPVCNPLYKELAEYENYKLPFVVVICVIAIFFNICNIVIFSKKEMISPTNSILLAIAVGDLSKVAPYLFYNLLQTGGFESQYWYNLIFLTVNVITFMMHSFTLWCGVVLSLFRFFYIQYFASSKVNVWFSLTRARLAVMLVFVSNVLMMVPYISVLKIDKKVNDTIGNNSAAIASPIDNSTQITHIYSGGMMDEYAFGITLYVCILSKILPCFFMSVFCFLIIKGMRETERRRESLINPNFKKRDNSHGNSKSNAGSRNKEKVSERAKTHKRTTRFLLIIMILYILYEFPMALLHILTLPEFGLDAIYCFFQNTTQILDTLGLVNNTINFLLYCFMSRQFRDCFKQTFCIVQLFKMHRESLQQRANPQEIKMSHATVLVTLPNEQDEDNESAHLTKSENSLHPPTAV